MWEHFRVRRVLWGFQSGVNLPSLRRAVPLLLSWHITQDLSAILDAIQSPDASSPTRRQCLLLLGEIFVIALVASRFPQMPVVFHVCLQIPANLRAEWQQSVKKKNAYWNCRSALSCSQRVSKGFYFEGKWSTFLVCVALFRSTTPRRVAGLIVFVDKSNMQAAEEITRRFLPAGWGIPIFFPPASGGCNLFPTNRQQPLATGWGIFIFHWRLLIARWSGTGHVSAKPQHDWESFCSFWPFRSAFKTCIFVCTECRFPTRKLHPRFILRMAPPSWWNKDTNMSK